MVGFANQPGAINPNTGLPFFDPNGSQPTPQPEDDPEDDARPPKPSSSPGAGYEWEWDEEAEEWKARRSQSGRNDLFSEYKLALEQYGFTGPDVEDFLHQAVQEDWSDATFTIKMRQSKFYLSNPLFAANAENARAGRPVKSEDEILAFSALTKQLARQFGFKEPSDSYVAMALKGDLSPAEIEHRFTIQQRINQFGGGVSMLYQVLMNDDPSDEDLYRIFDNEISTKDFEDKARAAEMRGRPLLLGLGIRPAEEQKALDMLGVTEDQAWSGYQKLANALPTVSRLASIDQMIASDPDNPFDSFGSLFASIFNPSGTAGLKAQNDFLLMMAREQARFNSGGGPVASQGRLIGLQSPDERAAAIR